MGIHKYPLKVSRFFMHNYCYLIEDRNNGIGVIVDPAWETNTIEQKIEELQISLVAILLTHSHPDHVHLAPELAKRHNCPTFMSRQEVDFYNFRVPNLVTIGASSELLFGEIEVLPIITPGHTKGSLCFLIEDALFTGDTIFYEGCGICHGHGADPRDMYDSLQRLKHQVPAKTKIYPGHSYGVDPGQPFDCLIRNNIYFHFETPDDFIKFRMRKNQPGIFRFN